MNKTLLHFSVILIFLSIFQICHWEYFVLQIFSRLRFFNSENVLHGYNYLIKCLIGRLRLLNFEKFYLAIFIKHPMFIWQTRVDEYHYCQSTKIITIGCLTALF